jgi:hypothetical protein
MKKVIVYGTIIAHNAQQAMIAWSTAIAIAIYSNERIGTFVTTIINFTSYRKGGIANKQYVAITAARRLS